jgi:hypothetical protein
MKIVHDEKLTKFGMIGKKKLFFGRLDNGFHIRIGKNGYSVMFR